MIEQQNEVDYNILLEMIAEATEVMVCVQFGYDITNYVIMEKDQVSKLLSGAVSCPESYECYRVTKHTNGKLVIN